MKQLSKYICFVLIAAMILTTPAYAAEVSTPRASNYFLSSCVYLYKISDTKFEVWFEVAALGIMDEVGASVIKVQRSSDGENWTTMKTYTKETYSQMICENTGTHTDCVSYTGTQGYYYRAYIILYAKNSSGTGELYRYTSPIRL